MSLDSLVLLMAVSLMQTFPDHFILWYDERQNLMSDNINCKFSLEVYAIL